MCLETSLNYIFCQDTHLDNCIAIVNKCDCRCTLFCFNLELFSIQNFSVCH